MARPGMRIELTFFEIVHDLIIRDLLANAILAGNLTVLRADWCAW